MASGQIVVRVRFRWWFLYLYSPGFYFVAYLMIMINPDFVVDFTRFKQVAAKAVYIETPYSKSRK